MYFDVSKGKIETSKPFISISSNLVILLILMPRFQILHFPGPEMAGLLKYCYVSKFWMFPKTKIRKNWQHWFDKSFLKNCLCDVTKVMKKVCEITRGWILNFLFQRIKFCFAFFWKIGHFWTWKLQNLESRHQNPKIPQVA